MATKMTGSPISAERLAMTAPGSLQRKQNESPLYDGACYFVTYRTFDPTWNPPVDCVCKVFLNVEGATLTTIDPLSNVDQWCEQITPKRTTHGCDR